MKTVGEILKETRTKKGIDFGQIEKATKIRKKYLQALEENKYAKIGPATTVKGFIKNYGKYLGLESPSLLAIFRRDYAEDKKGQVVLKGMAEPLNKPLLAWTPQRTFVAVIIFVFLFLGLFLGGHFVSLWLTR